MNAVYRELAERIRGEVLDLEHVIQRALSSWAQAGRMPDESAYLDSVALNLHGFYSGLERLFELIARHVDRTLPTGLTCINLFQFIRTIVLAPSDFGLMGIALLTMSALETFTQTGFQTTLV